MPTGTAFRLITLLAVILAMIGFSPPAGAQQPGDEPQPGADVDEAVVDAVAAGSSDFWVVLQARADLSGAAAIGDWAERGQYVYDQLTSTATSSQADLVADLRSRNVDVEPFWIVNALYVRNGDQSTLDLVVNRPEVDSVRAPKSYEIPEPIDEPDDPRIQAVEWGVANIRADQVWSSFGVRGEGITVANLDTGIEYQHPALVNQYRGNLGGGSFDHNYNWHDPGGDSCPDAPCDTHFHGTHVMGTMVGDDGAGNQIGVAPGANWIGAIGCPFGNCPDFDLFSSAEFVLAPTDLAGLNPRPDLRAHIVNNSWGSDNGPFEDPFFSEAVDSWTAAGIFGTFSNGNSGFLGCDSAGSPADDLDAWGVGAYDINNTIADFSSRGPGGEPPDQYVKPNIAAPGVDVRSAMPGASYGNVSGTSMAAPHLSGAVALMWSASPAVFGDIGGTRQILDDSAIDVEDTSCGGDADDNNVWGEGRLDAFAAVDLTPRGPTGTLVGTVTEAGTGSPISGATVTLSVEGRPRAARTGPDGTYRMTVPVGSYEVTASAVGYRDATGQADIVEGQTTTLDFALAALPRLSGTVTDGNDGSPVSGATVTATSGDDVVTAVTGPDGTYELLLEIGTWTVTFEADGYATETREVTFDADGQRVVLDVALRSGEASVEPTSIDELLLAGEERTTELTLSNTGTAPFDWEAFESGGRMVSGELTWLDRANAAERVAMAASRQNAPNPAARNGASAGPSAARWTPDGEAAPQQARVLVYADDFVHTAPNTYVDQALQRLGLAYTAFYDGNFSGFETALAEGGWDIVVFANDNYIPSQSSLDALNAYATAGGKLIAHSWTIEPYFPTHPLWSTLGVSLVSSDFDPPDPIHWWDPQHPLFVDPEEVPELTDLEGGRYGIYGQRVAPASETEALGGYTGAPTPDEAALVLANDETTLFRGFLDGQNDADLDGDTVPDGVELWQNSILGIEGGFFSDVPWLDVSPDSGTVAEGDSEEIDVTIDTTGLEPGEYTARVILRTTAVRQPRLVIPIRLVVTDYRQGINSGGGAYTDVSGDPWAADREFDADGSFGWEYASSTATIRRPVAGTQDDPLYQQARIGQFNYRFEDLPDGTYEVELHFAEIQRRLPGERLFDVTADATSLLVGYDIAEDVGLETAAVHRFTVEVSDGVLRIRMLQRQGNGRPILNAIRLTNRPDL
jgi:subtilisin family serine protease